MASKPYETEARVNAADLEHIYAQHKDRIFRFGLRFFDNVADAMDLVNDTFMQVLTNYKEFRGESAVSTWVYEIAVREALQKIRKQGGRSTKREKRTQIPLNEVIDELIANPDQEALAIRNEFKERINEVFHDLCKDCQTILFLWFHEGLKGSELADILDISINETYKKKDACLDNLRSRVGQ